MTLVAGLSDRVVRWLMVAAIAVLVLAAAGSWWIRHRDRATSARDRFVIDSLTTSANAWRLQAGKLDTVYFRDTVRVRETTARAIRATAAVETVTVVTRSGDSVRVDTLPAVRELRLACTDARETAAVALSTCEARVDALRHVFAADSSRQVATLDATVRAWRATASASGRRGFKRGTIVGAVLTIAVAVAARQIVR